MIFGFGQVEISINEPMRMDGYFDRVQASSGMTFPLMSTACIIKTSNHTLVIIGLDILGVDLNITQKVKATISKRYQIDEQHIILNASHTHASYASARFGDLGGFFVLEDPNELELSYYENLPNKIVESVDVAFKNLQKGSISYQQCTIEGVSSNRVNKHNSFNQVATIFHFKDAQDQLKGIWTIFANHPTVLNYTNTQVSNDFISYYHQKLKEHYPDITCLYLQGCAGDISSRFVKQDASMAQAQMIGSLFAKQVLACQNPLIQLTKLKDIKYRELIFDARNFSEDLDNQLKQAYDAYQSGQAQGLHHYELRSLYATYEGFLMAKQIQIKLKVPTLKASMSAIEWEELILITTPFETFTGIDMQIQAMSSKDVVVLGYTNGYLGYLVDEANEDNELSYERQMMVIKKDSYKQVLDQSQKFIEK